MQYRVSFTSRLRIYTLSVSVASIEPRLVDFLIDQAVNGLLAACLLMWRTLRPHDPPPFVRFFSEGMIAKQYEASDQAAPGMECHTQSLRLELANKKQIQYGSFLQGVRDLETHGRILSLDLQEACSKHAKILTDQVLESRKVIFITLATSSAPTLFKEDDNGQAIKYYQASTIICDEAGTVLRPFLLIACMSFVAAVRLVLAGDPNQLGKWCPLYCIACSR